MLARTVIQSPSQLEKMKGTEVQSHQNVKAIRTCYYCKGEGRFIKQCSLKRQHRQEKKAPV